MNDLLECIDAVLWLALVLLLFRDRKKWNKCFQELHDAMKDEIQNG